MFPVYSKIIFRFVTRSIGCDFKILVTFAHSRRVRLLSSIWKRKFSCCVCHIEHATIKAKMKKQKFSTSSLMNRLETVFTSKTKMNLFSCDVKGRAQETFFFFSCIFFFVSLTYAEHLTFCSPRRRRVTKCKHKNAVCRRAYQNNQFYYTKCLFFNIG